MPVESGKGASEMKKFFRASVSNLLALAAASAACALLVPSAAAAAPSAGCTAINNGTLNHTSNLSDSTFQVVTRAVNAGLTV